MDAVTHRLPRTLVVFIVSAIAFVLVGQSSAYGAEEAPDIEFSIEVTDGNIDVGPDCEFQGPSFAPVADNGGYFEAADNNETRSATIGLNILDGYETDCVTLVPGYVMIGETGWGDAGITTAFGCDEAASSLETIQCGDGFTSPTSLTMDVTVGDEVPFSTYTNTVSLTLYFD